MGAGASSNVNITKQELVNNAIASAIMKTAQSCSSNQTINQAAHLTYTNTTAGDITLSATASADISCIQFAEQKADLQANIKNELKALVEQQASAGPSLFSIGLSSNVSDQEQTIINTISSNIEISTIQESVARQSIGQDVAIDFTNSTVRNLLISAGSSAVITAVQTDTKTASARTDLVNAMEATSKQKSTTGLAIGGVIAVVILLMIMSSCACVFMNKANGSGGPVKAGGGGLSNFLSSPAATQILTNPSAIKALSGAMV